MGRLVASDAGLAAAAEGVRAWSGPVGVDTETTGLDPARDRVRLVQIAAGDETFVIDLFAFSEPATALAPLFAALSEADEQEMPSTCDEPFGA